MKEKIYLLIFVTLLISACKKENPFSVSVESENIFIQLTTVTFHVTYEYPSVLKEIKLHLSSHANMADVVEYLITINKKEFNITIENLNVQNIYYYFYEFISGTTSVKSEIKSFKINDTLQETPIELNGVKWAPFNVDAPGFFTGSLTASGMFYQWNKKIGWSSTDPMVNSNGDTVWSNILGLLDEEWMTVNDPCPVGWRVPTPTEFGSLPTSPVWGELNGISGRFYGRGEQSVFFPAVGGRASQDGVLCVYETGYYWSSEWRTYLLISSNYGSSQEFIMPSCGCSVRCVKE